MFEFSKWITVHADLWKRYLELPDRSQQVMREIVTEIYRRGADKWLRKLSIFVLQYMSTDIRFYKAFADYFSDEEIQAFDKLTDELFLKAKRNV